MAKKKKKNGSAGTGIEQLIDQYEKLSSRDKARIRSKLLQRAEADEEKRQREKQAKADVVVEPAKKDDPKEFEPFSDQLVRYFGAVRDVLSSYVPFDRYDPGDENSLNLLRRETLHVLEPLEWLLKTYFRYEVNGLENVPKKGRGMIISNHGLLPVDGWFLFFEILRATGRWPRGLTDWRVYAFPWLRQLFMDMGMVVGSHKNGDRLLQNEELLFIMPGGSKEAWKSSRYRYRLLWRGRYGFVRMALRNRCPIIPSANVGTDDTYRTLFDGYTTAYKLFRTRKAVLPISIPIGLGILPFPVKMTQYVGEPFLLPYPPEAEKDPAIVEQCQEMVKSKVYELMDIGLREREERKISGILPH